MISFARLAALFLAAAAPAGAQGLRDFCPDRPGLGTPPCTIDAGHAAVELGLADWTLERDGGARTDTLQLGEILVRLGLSDRIEAQLGWTAYGRVKERNAAGRSRMDGIGDVTLALRANLAHPDGKGFSAALMPYATLPTGNGAIGAGDWSAGLLVPVSYELPHGLQLGLTGQVEAAADEDRHGRHLAYGGVAGLSAELSETLSATAELSAVRDEDPSGRSTELLAGLSAGWMAKDDLQLDVGANIGLNEAAPDVQLYAGVSKRF
ncbi:MAG: transporter [Alphaproteobacteria bacterium]|nr:transporter [Alphaproteobacteria bacterium]MBV9370752.1 transporter [Alphaproteobacteria bacterium]MBV9899825.1 transporter [Alphaproteobacteria bacterium]